MSSPSKDEAGLNMPPKKSSPENIASNIESIFEADQKVEAPKLLEHEQEVPNRVTLPYRGRKRHGSTQASGASPQSKRPRRIRTPVTNAAIQEADKEIEVLVEQELRIVQALWDEGGWDHLEGSFTATGDIHDAKREYETKPMELPQETETQEPTVGASEDVEEKNQIDDAVASKSDDVPVRNISICTRRISNGLVTLISQKETPRNQL
ncbi:hypothetical protein FGADI_8768 [Fusarium gaditjirri]|uniref:Uncharacterized protein n=1 Tax=Fusarium gaditjirri TaxID=282569 RepID=A0A8H4T1P7_9HYPO|nr:hypothetical protein FGADI_8768 [Fusarium gaditjirri]